MNHRVHSSIISYLREMNARDAHPSLKKFDTMTDEQIVRLMFQNFRGRDKTARGLRLTNHGLEIMRAFFQAYEIESCDGRRPGSSELVYLDRRAKLPYHIQENGSLVMFDPELGIKLKLADGDIRTLIEMDG
jgi:hypothetical protein